MGDLSDARVLELAARFQQYPGSPEITLRGVGIVEFGRALLPQWVSVDERLPEVGMRVLVYVRDFPLLPIQTDEWNEQRESPVEWSSETVAIGFGWDEHEFDEVSHWMPLPSAPQDETNAELLSVRAALDGDAAS
jgi:hypothetical protein